MRFDTTLELAPPRLSEGRFSSLDVLTDERLFDALGVRIAFTGKEGGVSEGDFASLNLGAHVGDVRERVLANRAIVLEALGASGMPVVVPNQVHGDVVERIAGPLDAERADERAQEGCDALLVEGAGVVAMLCFADCMPVIVVSPSGRFAVVHAGWRGVMGEIAAHAVVQLAESDRHAGFRGDPASFNVYIGPHIRSACFETSEEIHARFVERFGEGCSSGYRHIDLARAQRTSLERVGVLAERVCDAEICTVCGGRPYYSYRLQGGRCGRHGAVAFRAR